MKKDSKIFSKNDIVLILVLLVGSAVLALFLLLTKSSGKSVIVSIDGEIVAAFSLDTDAEYEIEGYGGGTNYLVIKDGYAYLSEASCPDHLCVNMGKIKNSGQSIICLPNRVLIEISQDEASAEAEYDTVVY